LYKDLAVETADRVGGVLANIFWKAGEGNERDELVGLVGAQNSSWSSVPSRNKSIGGASGFHASFLGDTSEDVVA
jgi:hypothetical protein